MIEIARQMDTTGVNIYHQDTEHFLQRVLAGNVDDVRRRLTIALERLDYDFIDEGDFEIQAKRNARGWAGAGASADVLDYARTLVIKFKPLNENLTRASFVYIVKHPWLQRGEKEILTREAETLATLSTVRVTDKNCAVCGAETTADSRFCRKCGAAMTSDETALEVLRMSAEVRSGHTSVAMGTIFGVLLALINFAALIAAIFSGVANAGVVAFLGSGIVLSLLVILSNGFGWRRLNKALKTGSKANQSPQAFPDKSGRAISGSNTNALPASPAYSVIENTTELLQSDDRLAAEIKRQKGERNTGKTFSE